MEDVESDWAYWLGQGDDAPDPRRERDTERGERRPALSPRRRYEELLRV